MGNKVKIPHGTHRRRGALSNDPLGDAVTRVVSSGNCSGCGGCTALSPRVSMQMSEQGWLRPTVSPINNEAVDRSPISTEGVDSAALFHATCPGVGTSAPLSGDARSDALFGKHLGVWVGHAADAHIRHEGSSGGVLTALTAWLIETGQVNSVRGASTKPGDASRTVPVSITSRDQALASAGSRYAPVSMLDGFSVSDDDRAFVGKPCEASALRALRAQGVLPPSDTLILSFFCAGTPSQRATDRLTQLVSGKPSTQVDSIRYRGRGWPGAFGVIDNEGYESRMSYEESWGQHLGRDLQWRCKVCPDGVGEASDIAVGDFWFGDQAGYPQFVDAPGRSVIIARTSRGLSAIRSAAAAGVILMEPMDLAALAKVQPLQVERRSALAGRLAGRLLSGKRVPKYHGYSLVTLAFRNPLATLRAALGTWLRSVRGAGRE